ncbi:MAG: 16S rRNA (cytosine(1402)-N(4))-methyltransferase RsmH [Clostridium sp.]|nr:16S rRNA (cytosine(1402)-N(4))-methyltransferase RsmH [Clostridium sp.]
MEFKHTSVLLKETIESLRVKPDGIYIDGTLGGGGHSYALASKLGEKGKLIGIDQDEDAIEAAAQRLEPFGDKVVIVRDNYCNIKNILQDIGVEKVDGIILDLGVSSYQLDCAERGFSYKLDADLDMRMDVRQSLSAKDIVNTYSEMELYRVIKDYGEEQFAKNIAKHIVQVRKESKIETTEQLNEIIRAAIPIKRRRNGGHPSKRTFQALRIECNRELEILRNSLDELIQILNPGGRLCIITFHSLEDRIVKTAFKRNENPCICPPDFPVCTCGKKPQGRVVFKKPVLPSPQEISKNKRSKSAKLRVFERESVN